MMILFYITGVFYDLRSILPGVWGEILVRVNPIAAVIDNVRACLLYGHAPDAFIMVAWLGISLIFCLIGLKLTYSHENTYVKVI